MTGWKVLPEQGTSEIVPMACIDNEQRLGHVVAQFVDGEWHWASLDAKHTKVMNYQWEQLGRASDPTICAEQNSKGTPPSGIAIN